MVAVVRDKSYQLKGKQNSTQILMFIHTTFHLGFNHYNPRKRGFPRRAKGWSSSGLDKSQGLNQQQQVLHLHSETGCKNPSPEVGLLVKLCWHDCLSGVRRNLTPLADITTLDNVFMWWKGREGKGMLVPGSLLWVWAAAIVCTSLRNIDPSNHAAVTPPSFCSRSEAWDSPGSDKNY